MPRRREPTPATPHSRAWTTLEANLDGVMHVLAMGARELTALKADTLRVQARLNKQATPAGKAAGERLLRSMKRYASRMDLRIDRSATARLWQVVILVTCVEAY